MGMSVSPLDRITPPFAVPAGHDSALPEPEALAAAHGFRTQLTVLTAFWIYVALSNVLYANSMQASFSSMKMERVFAPWDARLIQHLLLYPLFLLAMWRSLRTGWRPLWKTVPIQLLCAVGFAVLAAPALGMQLSPHTLFNLLHTIRGQISWDPPAAQAMVVQLGDLLRRLLNAGEREFSRLSDELQFVALYLELQQKRFADRLTIAAPGPDDIPRAWVPSLILQPLVENAVVHGLAGHEGAVTIRVEAGVSGETLSLRVLNTIAPDRASGATGIGLTNVRERLAVQFGERATFEAGPIDNNVWQAQIHMPLLRDGPESAARPEARSAL